ncbi:hypothetical protein ACFOY4_14950 [Actinomadura syzygii]|uniref:SH3 domain-containing protein n=1 Tax=Actinomadura syzygii TaxID=1427538 RepID=A0A5D0U0X0_9ACTN|nr:hypothetical protein [Actinomadura syzygii]TYC11717.1 hypothetical protein FXF65_26925 [Actinomadura syzygii]
MELGVKLGAGLAAFVLAGSALSYGAVAEAAAPPPQPGQDQSAQAAPGPAEEGQGPGAIFVGPEGNALALQRMVDQDEQRVRLCRGTVVVERLNIRRGPGLSFAVVGHYNRGTHITTDWDTIQRRDGYLWVRLANSTHWIADYKLGTGNNGKWYVRYSNC